jgi:hypothetical protein
MPMQEADQAVRGCGLEHFPYIAFPPITLSGPELKAHPAERSKGATRSPATDPAPAVSIAFARLREIEIAAESSWRASLGRGR